METNTLELCMHCGYDKKSHPISYKQDGVYKTCENYHHIKKLPEADVVEVTIFVRCPNGALLKLIDPKIFIIDDEGIINWKCRCGDCDGITYRARIERMKS